MSDQNSVHRQAVHPLLWCAAAGTALYLGLAMAFLF